MLTNCPGLGHWLVCNNLGSRYGVGIFELQQPALVQFNICTLYTYLAIHRTGKEEYVRQSLVSEASELHNAG